MKYGIIYADPPWQFKSWSATGRGRSAEQHYPVLDTEAIAALPVRSIARNDCALFLWATSPMLQDAMRVMERWGFAYKTIAIVWTKPQIGCGYWTRAQSEYLLLGTIGKPKPVRHDVRQHIHARPLRHSAKPAEVRDRIVALLGALPRVELFARERVPGWDAVGDEIDGRDIRDALPSLLNEEIP